MKASSGFYQICSEGTSIPSESSTITVPLFLAILFNTVTNLLRMLRPVIVPFHQQLISFILLRNRYRIFHGRFSELSELLSVHNLCECRSRNATESEPETNTPGTASTSLNNITYILMRFNQYSYLLAIIFKYFIHDDYSH